MILLLPGFAQANPRFGLWVEAEGTNRPWRSLAEYQEFQKFVEEPKFTDFYCQVYRGGRSWYPSVLADDTPYREAMKQGFDPLGDTIRMAHARGQKVHGWVNVLRVIRNFEAPVLKAIGRPAVLIDSYGNSLLDYDDDGNPPGDLAKHFRLGTPGIWLDASNERVRQYIVETIKDMVVAYPELDGVHLDMVRYPLSIYQPKVKVKKTRPRFGYSEEAIKQFYAFAGKEAPKIDQSLIRRLNKSQAWPTWQRAQVTILVVEIREMLKKVAPHMELSAAVIASPKRSYNETLQDWSQWVKGGVLDTVIPMSYTRKVELVTTQSKHAVSSAANVPAETMIGLGAWLTLNNPALLVQQGKIAMQSGARGVTLFSYSNLLNDRGKDLVRQFESSVFPSLKDVMQN